MILGDVINAMCLCDYDNDGELEVIIPLITTNYLKFS